MYRLAHEGGRSHGSQSPNAAADSFFAAYLRETAITLATGRFADEAEARRETLRPIAFLNHRRRRAGMRPPSDCELRHRRDS